MDNSYIISGESSTDAVPDQWSFADVGKTRPLSRDLSPHVTDEVFNSVSHLSAAMLSLLGTTLLITGSADDVWKIVGFSIYGGCLIGMFVCSVLHHSINSSDKVSRSQAILANISYFNKRKL